MWSKGIVEWQEGGTAFLSVPFTWDLPLAYSRAVGLKQQGFEVRAGGPAVELMLNNPKLEAKVGLPGVAKCGGHLPALGRHNPDATFTSRGCIRRCRFCAVHQIEPVFEELEDWVPAPIVCDNNILATSMDHFDRVVDRLVPIRGVDFNQGLDARLLNAHHIEGLQKLNMAKATFAWDNASEESPVLDAIAQMRESGFPKSKITCLVLINNGESQAEALYRMETLKSVGVRGCPMRFQPLDTLEKDDFLSPEWTRYNLARFVHYWFRQNWLSKVPFAEYVY